MYFLFWQFKVKVLLLENFIFEIISIYNQVFFMNISLYIIFLTNPIPKILFKNEFFVM